MDAGRKGGATGRLRVLAAGLTLVVALVGCRRGADPDGEASPVSAESGAPVPGDEARADAPDPAGDAFMGLEQLRPTPWTAWPVENVDIAGYDGWRIDAVHGGFERERGLRFETRAQDFVLAIADADVSELRRGEDDELILSLDHGQGIESHYGPLGDALVHAGLPVTRGTAIGLSQGTHLQLRVTVDGVDIDPLLALRQPLHRWPALLVPLPPPPPAPEAP